LVQVGELVEFKPSEILILKEAPRGTGFDANHTWRQLMEELQDIAALQLTADDHLARNINAVDLKYRFSDVETDCRKRLHDWLCGTASGPAVLRAPARTPA
jgi:hypothetical protein